MKNLLKTKFSAELARLGDTGGHYYSFWHARGNILVSQVAAPMPRGLFWSTCSPTWLCTPKIAAPSPPGGRWLSISLHAAAHAAMQ